SGRVDPDERIMCAGYLDSPNRYRCFVYTHYGVGHGETDLSDALAQSCNVHFFANARRTGPDPIVLWAERFGFGQRTGVDLPGESAGHLPKPPPAPVASGSGRSN